MENLGGGADGGVDLRLKKDDQLTLVQCKRWKSKKVGLPIVRELLGTITAESAHAGIMVTTSTYTSEAISFAQQQGIQLIDGNTLADSITERGHISQETLGISPATPSAPLCPNCGDSMINRIAKTGTNA